ncbi:hypothetical protein K438DRAFT_1985012 [Mycena galopus ATCC 62051]|nr:hypothetical protein K438DRAFT_1985012 [Mycena galopus ATCC 62051]
MFYRFGWDWNVTLGQGNSITRIQHVLGFLSVGNKITKENSTSGVAEPQALDCQPETPGQVSAVVGGVPEEHSGSVEEEEEEEEEEGETENDRDNDLRGAATSENIPADPSITAAQQNAAEILEELRGGRIPKDDSLATASDLALDQLHYKDFPTLCRARASLEIKSRDSKIDVFFRARITAMLGTLNLNSELSYTWRQSSLIVSRSQGHGIRHARNIRTWLHAFLSRGVLPFHRLGAFRATVLDDEDFSLPIQLHLQKIAKENDGHISAQDIVDCIADSSDMQDLIEKSGAKRKSISLRTAQRWLHKTGWRFGKKKNSIYLDGHERPDVVEYCEGFIARWKDCETRLNIYNNNGELERGPQRTAQPGEGPIPRMDGLSN